MPNALTGDFDVVAQFAIPAVNRLLAAMHRVERFPHSWSMRVKDIRRPITDTLQPAVVGVLDSFGDPVSDHDQIRNPNPHPGLFASLDPVLSALDPIVNIGNAGIHIEPIQPSNLQGRAQIQIFPPTIEIADSSGSNIAVHLEMLIRYIPDPNTSPAAQFFRGDLRLIAPIQQVASEDAHVVEIDIKGVSIGVSFTPQWSSSPLSAEDLTAINQLIRNAMRTAFLPSSNPLPEEIAHVQFKTFQGSTSAVATLLNMRDEENPGSEPRGNSNSASNVFLHAGNDFALGVGVDFVKRKFNAAIAAILANPIPKTSSYTITPNDASITLENNQILLTVKGHATSPHWYAPNFGFTLKQWFTLQVNGGFADLVIGSMSFDTDSFIVDLIRGRIRNRLQESRDRALADGKTFESFRNALSADQVLGKFVNSLIQPAQKRGGPFHIVFQEVTMAYSSVEISPNGIVLRGSIGVAAWPAPHIEFQQIPVNNQGPLGVGGGVINQGPDYSALKTWIPGGVVLGYEWKSNSQGPPGFVDEHKFVYLDPGPGISSGFAAKLIAGYQPMCLTVHGSRLSSSGPVVRQTVTASACVISGFPIGGLGAIDADPGMIALTQPGTGGRVEVAGHTTPLAAAVEAPAPNLIVHFGEPGSVGGLSAIIQALQEGGRDDAPTAILAIMPAGGLSNAQHVEGVTYAEDRNGEWERRFGLRISRRPLTAVVSPDGKVVWQHEGEIEAATLAGALRKYLVAGKPIAPTLPPRALRLGDAPPNFLFEYAPGSEVTLRKVAGRPAVIVFWRSTSAQSIELIHELTRASQTENGKRPLILAVNDGEPAEVARRAAKENRITARVVTDPDRSISSAYGVNTWPTTVGVDASGVTRTVRFGRLAAETGNAGATVTQGKSDYARNGQ